MRTMRTKANEGDQNYKDALKTKYYELISGYLDKPECRLIIKVVIHVAEKFSPFLKRMQSSSPMITHLYPDSCRLLREVLSDFIKDSALPGQEDGDKLSSLDLTKRNLDLPKLSPSAETCYKALTKNCQKTVTADLFAMYRKIAGYLQDKLMPLKSPLVKSLTVLDPKVHRVMVGFGKNDILAAAKIFRRFSSAEIDSLSLQWDRFIANNCTPLHKERMDNLYARVFRSLNADDFPELLKFVKIALSLPVSNGAVERGFSETKRLVSSRESISLATLTGRKVGNEVVKRYGGATNVPISTPLVISHVNARRVYRERLENEKKERERARKQIRDEAAATRKRRAEEKEESDFRSKLKKLEDEEKHIRDILKADQAQKLELDHRMSHPSGLAAMKSAFALSKQLSDGMDKKRAKLDELSKQKLKLVQSRANKKK